MTSTRDSTLVERARRIRDQTERESQRVKENEAERARIALLRQAGVE